MATMSDIAEKAGVSRTAVSHVLGGNQLESVRVSEATRQRILQVADILGYRPNQLARAVALGKTRMFGYLVEEPRYEPYWNIIMGALAAAEEIGFTLKVLSVTKDNLAERVRQCAELRLSGLIVRFNDEKSSIFEETNRAQIPVVTVDEAVPQPFGSRVASDDAPGCRSVIEHLMKLGHRRIGFISSGFPQQNLSTGDVGTLRERLFLHATAALNLEVPDGYITYDTVTVYGASSAVEVNDTSTRAATQALLNHPDGRPTAIFCWRDETAMLAVRECRRQGLRVPQDISIVGFSDISAARFFDPPLSTVRMPWEELGRKAVYQLTERMSGEFDPSPTAHLIPGEFVARASSGPAPY